MSWLSVLGRRQHSKAGQSKSERKGEHLVPRREYCTASPGGLLASLDESDRIALRALFRSTQGDATPFNSLRILPDGSRVPFFGDYSRLSLEERKNIILGATNVNGALRGLQILLAKKKLTRLGLPDEVTPAATEFLEWFVNTGMDGQRCEEIG